ncbi:MAG: hypothetical protein LAQ30_30480 [Acidobacteriia bacterium]|nr:hypothetical protein [Terriglobia bacterium]
MKRQALDYLASSEFAVFQSVPHSLEGLPLILWDVEREPDYRRFLEVAQKAGVKIVLFADARFEAADLDELEEHLEETDLDRDEQREYQARIRELRRHEGETCGIEMAFDYNSRIYVYETQPDWYDEFVTLEDEIMERISETEDDDSDDSLGGYFSKN